METDYSVLTPELFAREVKRFLLFGLMNEATEKDGAVRPDGALNGGEKDDE